MQKRGIIYNTQVFCDGDLVYAELLRDDSIVICVCRIVDSDGDEGTMQIVGSGWWVSCKIIGEQNIFSTKIKNLYKNKKE